MALAALESPIAIECRDFDSKLVNPSTVCLFSARRFPTSLINKIVKDRPPFLPWKEKFHSSLLPLFGWSLETVLSEDWLI